jgi:hypothetical protein
MALSASGAPINGAKRQKVTRAWDNFFAAHIDAITHDGVSDELTKYRGARWLCLR